MGFFSKQEHWSGLPFPTPGALPDPGMEPKSPGLQVDSLPSDPLFFLSYLTHSHVFQFCFFFKKILGAIH